MKIVLNLLVFCLVLFVYLHVYFHFKVCNDLEVYEIDEPSKDRLEDICDLRQPVMFQYMNENMLKICNRNTIEKTYGAFEVKLRNLTDVIGSDDEMYIPFSFTNALDVIKEDVDKKYLVEKNDEFLEETAMNKIFKYNDAFVRPPMVSNCMYDILCGGDGVRTPFRYDLNYRNYYMVTEGEVRIKLAPPKSSKYLYQHTDYENFEFCSNVNPWDVQNQYRNDFAKIKCLEVIVKKGYMIHIPAFWWYSIEFGKETTVATFKYRTYMNNVAILPKLCMQMLQTQNIKRRIATINRGVYEEDSYINNEIE